MGEFCELNQPEYDKWLEERPPVVRAVAEKYPPNELFELKTTGQIVSIISYAEDGTVRILVDPQYNEFPHNLYPLEVFGVNPSDLDSAQPKDSSHAQR